MSRKISKEDFLELMKFPAGWGELYTDELAGIQVGCYVPGAENSPEHFRFGAFCWWEKNLKTKEQLDKLIELTYLDPDQGMGAHARVRLSKLDFS